MATLNVQCPACWGQGEVGQRNPKLPRVACQKCEKGRVTVDAGCEACGQTGRRVVGQGWNYDTKRFEPIIRRCGCVVLALESLGFYRGRRKRPA